MMLPSGLRAGGILPAARRGGGVPAARTVRATGNLFYQVLRKGSASLVVRWERNKGGSGGTDLGDKWPETRVTGLGTMANAAGDPATDAVWSMDEVGACDSVGRSSGGTNFGSYHGLGAAGSLNSQSFTIDGVSCDPFSADVEGETLEVRNDTTASDGTNFYRRELVVSNQPDGSLKFAIPTVSASGMSLVYVGMPMATGDGYSEIDVQFGTDWNTIPLGTGVASAGLASAKAVRMRDPATGLYVMASGSFPSIGGFVRARTEKQTVEQRTKTYLAQFSSVAALAGAEWVMAWGVGAAGSVAPPTNLVDANWLGSWSNAPGPTGGTVVVNGADLDMTWSSGTSNLRFSSPIDTVGIGKVYAISVDLVSNSASTRLMLASNGSSTSSPTLSITADVGRNIEVFTASYANQRMMVRAASTVAASTKWRNPAAYEMAS